MTRNSMLFAATAVLACASGAMSFHPAAAQSAAASSASQAPAAPVDYTKPDCKDRALMQPRLMRLFPDGGQVTIDCALTPDGAMASCRVVKSQPADPRAGEIVADLFLCYAHVDPKAIAGGIGPDSRKKFTLRWDKSTQNQGTTFLN